MGKGFLLHCFCGGLAERLIALALGASKDGSRQGSPRLRGFESHALRSMMPSVCKRSATSPNGN